MNKKVAMVVGGGSGIGAAAARQLAQDGFEVAVLSSSGKGEALMVVRSIITHYPYLIVAARYDYVIVNGKMI